MYPILRPALAGAALAMAVPATAAIDIVFDYSYDTGAFFDAPKKSVLDSAASVFEAALLDPLLAITSSGSNSFDIVFSSPGSGSTVTVEDYSVAAGELVVFVGGRDIGSLGLGGPGGWGASGTSEFLDTAAARGQAGALASPAWDFGPWGGSIVFDSSASWYFDADTGSDESFSGFDFYSVALHELAHVLGIGTADSWYADITAGTFTGASSVGEFGGPVPLHTDGGHWAEGTMSTTVFGVPQEAALDPTIASGTRKHLTELDWDGLSDVGWEVSVVPEAEIWALMLAGLGLVAATRRRSSAG